QRSPTQDLPTQRPPLRHDQRFPLPPANRSQRDYLQASSASSEMLQHLVTFISAEQVLREGGKQVRLGMLGCIDRGRHLQSLTEDARNFRSFRHIQMSRKIGRASCRERE